MRDPTQAHGSLASGASAADVINTIEATGRSVGLVAADVSSLAADISPGPFRDPHAGVWMPHHPAAPPSDGQPSAGFWCPLGSVEAQVAARTADWGGVEDAALAAERVRRMAADDELHAVDAVPDFSSAKHLPNETTSVPSALASAGTSFSHPTASVNKSIFAGR